MRDMIAVKHLACRGTAWWQTPESIDDEFLCWEDVDLVNGSRPFEGSPLVCGTCGGMIVNALRGYSVRASLPSG